MAVMRHKEAIHSGHFMVSDFEAEAEDEVEMALVSPPPPASPTEATTNTNAITGMSTTQLLFFVDLYQKCGLPGKMAGHDLFQLL